MQVVILAGGKGTRLWPLTQSIPKPMAQVEGRPFLEHLLLMLRENGLMEILLLVGYMRERIIDHFGDGQALGMSIEYSAEQTPIGTGGAVKNAERFLHDWFILMNGDTYLPIDYTQLIRVACERDVLGTVVAYDNGDCVATPNLRVKNGLVRRYSKGELDSGLQYVDAGVQVFQKTVLTWIEPGAVTSLENEVFPRLIAQEQMAAYVTSQRFYDIGTPDILQTFRKKMHAHQ